MTEKQACSDDIVVLEASDLPLCCPREDQSVTFAHPRVYLPVERLGQVACPYCGTVYVMANQAKDESAA